MDIEMVKVHTLGLMEESMKGNGSMGNMMVKEHSLPLVETSMKENSRMEKNGPVRTTTPTDLFEEDLQKESGRSYNILILNSRMGKLIES